MCLHKIICCGYSLESPARDNSNEYPKRMFLYRTVENYPLIINNEKKDNKQCLLDTPLVNKENYYHEYKGIQNG